jgi:hypothetical protein
MPPPQHTSEQTRVDRLRRAAEKTFGELYPAENNLLDKAPRSQGDWVLGSSDKGADNDAVKDGKGWERNREIRSVLLRWLCVDEYAKKQVDPHGLNVRGARISGTLDLSYVSVPFQLSLKQCYFEERLNLFHSELPELTLSASWVPGLDAGHAKINGLFLDEGFRSDGQVTLGVVHIAGDLDCSDGTFHNPNRDDPETGTWDANSGTALHAERLTVEGSVFLAKRGPKATFQSEGEVRLVGAQIQGDLICDGGKFSNLARKTFPGSGIALNADSVTVKGLILLRHGFEANGTVVLQDAECNTLICEGGTFTNPFQEKDEIGGDALNLNRAVVKGGVFLRSTETGIGPRFSANGTVSLIASRIGGELDMQYGDFTKANLDLSGATAATVFDSGEGSWPKPNNLHVGLFQYGHIDPDVPKKRLQWLGLQPDDEFNTQSYVQLAKVLQQGGDDDGARLVLQTAAKLQARHGHRYWQLHPDNWLAASIGYGYRPIWAVGYISIMTAIGWIIYRRGYLAGTIVPTDKDAYSHVKSKHCLPPYYPRFVPLIFSLENSLPLVKLGQADKWQPEADSSSQAALPSELKPTLLSSIIDRSLPVKASTENEVIVPELGSADQVAAANAKEPSRGEVSLAHQEIAEPDSFRGIQYGAGLQSDRSEQSSVTPLRRHGTSPRFLNWFIWIQILLGWLVATLFVAGITGIVRKQ